MVILFPSWRPPPPPVSPLTQPSTQLASLVASQDGTISDLENQYGDPKKIGGIPIPGASFGVGGEFGVGGKFDNGGR